jgi:hypothetical protein
LGVRHSFWDNNLINSHQLSAKKKHSLHPLTLSCTRIGSFSPHTLDHTPLTLAADHHLLVYIHSLHLVLVDAPALWQQLAVLDPPVVLRLLVFACHHKNLPDQVCGQRGLINLQLHDVTLAEVLQRPTLRLVLSLPVRALALRQQYHSSSQRMHFRSACAPHSARCLPQREHSSLRTLSAESRRAWQRVRAAALSDAGASGHVTARVATCSLPSPAASGVGPPPAFERDCATRKSIASRVGRHTILPDSGSLTTMSLARSAALAASPSLMTLRYCCAASRRLPRNQFRYAREDRVAALVDWHLSVVGDLDEEVEVCLRGEALMVLQDAAEAGQAPGLEGDV